MIRIVFAALLLAGCAAIHAGEVRSAHCAPICDRYSGIPVLSTVHEDGPRSCRCDAWPSAWEREAFPSAAWSVTVRCEPDCVTVAEDARRLRELKESSRD